jgi:AcrR family transcriptional regulator
MTKTSRRLPAAERKAQIAAATLQILARHGARELTAQHIAREVGLRDGSLFRHFDSIEAMVASAIDLFEQRMAQSFPDAGGEPMAQLQQFFLHRANLVSRHPDVMRLAFNDRLTEVAGDEGAQQVRRMVERSVGFVRRCLLEAQRDGVVRKDVAVDVLVWTVIGVMRGATGATRNLPAKKRAAPAAEEAWRSLRVLILANQKTVTKVGKRKRRTGS